MTNEKVMFEFGGNAYPDKARALEGYSEGGSPQLLITEGASVLYRVHCGTFGVLYEKQEAFYLAKHTALLKAQGWLSPDDQHSFCIGDASSKGYVFENDREYLIPWGGTVDSKVLIGSQINSWIKNACSLTSWYFIPLSLETGTQDPHETRRLEALGVKRYEKGGE